ncbi:MAG: CRISPR system precrRNA processing endoribonuclease RAMP protein Cas6 [Rhodocyclaceae bacterium]|nr:CRISPR system precrRNA processing endoribonuclease RAMP protein Cas6 [Rhodocyclaceae bacterium]
MIALPLARYRLEFTVETPLSLPAYAGSTLRGAFGGALRATACITKQKTCESCPLLRSCPYAVIFETPPPADGHALQKFTQVPHPYVIEPPDWGEKMYAPGEPLAFHLVLAGRALDQLPLVLWAFAKAFKRGVGKGDGTARLSSVTHIGEIETVVLENMESTLAEHPHTVLPEPIFSNDTLTLTINTPLRLQKNGHPIDANTLTARDLLMALVRRIALIHEFHGAGALPLNFTELAQQAEAIASEKELRWRDWTRYSSRQNQKMALGGVVGKWTLTGDLAPFMPFLHLGQWLHAGKEATFGMGAYRLKTQLDTAS